MPLLVRIEGLPRPGGSKKGFLVGGRIRIVDAAKGNARWKQLVRDQARLQHAGGPLLGPLRVWACLLLPRPKGHFGSGRNAGQLKPSAPVAPDVRPDLTKLWRSTEDALSGILWKDDAQIIEVHKTKAYGSPGVLIAVQRVPGGWSAADGLPRWARPALGLLHEKAGRGIPGAGFPGDDLGASLAGKPPVGPG